LQVWKRINRIPRDIPNQSIIAGNKVTNLRQILLQKMAKRGLRCKCIRCREVKDSVVDLENAELKERQHEASGNDASRCFRFWERY
jgi:histone acetyltransferase (RNA polymerase elongator complex component)